MNTFLPADIALFYINKRSFISKAIGFFSKTKSDKSDTLFSHVGIIGRNGDIIEALSNGVVVNKIQKYIDKGDYVKVVRKKDISSMSRKDIAEYAYCQVGKKYGYLKIGAHFIDYWLSKAVGKDVYFTRGIVKNEKYPICSWVISYAYYKILKFTFKNVPPNACAPDDIGDEVEQNIDKWETIFDNYNN